MILPLVSSFVRCEASVCSPESPGSSDPQSFGRRGVEPAPYLLLHLRFGPVVDHLKGEGRGRVVGATHAQHLAMLPFHKRARANSIIEIGTEELEAVELPAVRPPSVRPGAFASVRPSSGPMFPQGRHYDAYDAEEMT